MYGKKNVGTNPVYVDERKTIEKLEKEHRIKKKEYRVKVEYIGILIISFANLFSIFYYLSS